MVRQDVLVVASSDVAAETTLDSDVPVQAVLDSDRTVVIDSDVMAKMDSATVTMYSG